MSPTQAKILARLEAAGKGEFVSSSDLIKAIGREISLNNLRVQIRTLRSELPPRGLRIESETGYGARGYRLIRKEGVA